MPIVCAYLSSRIRAFFLLYFFLLTIYRIIISRACVAGGESVRNNSLMMQICVSVTHPVGACKLWCSHRNPLASCTVKKVYFSKSHFCAQWFYENPKSDFFHAKVGRAVVMASAQKKLPLSPWGDGLTFRAGHALVRMKKERTVLLIPSVLFQAARNALQWRYFPLMGGYQPQPQTSL